MRCPRSERVLIATSLLAVFAFLVVLVPPARADCPGGVLLNPGFEEGFSTRGWPEGRVANGWHPWWQEDPRESFGGQPEYKPQHVSEGGKHTRVREGNYAQKWFNSWKAHNAGLYQQVNVPANSLVTLRAWAYAWSSKKENFDVSDGGRYFLQVGIDPAGGTDWASPNVVWSPRDLRMDQWVQLTVQAKATGGTVTAFLRGDAEWPVVHNDAYFDDACLTYVAPTPVPTSRPRPTNTPTDTPTPTITPEPTHTPTTTPSPSPSPTQTPVAGVIRVLAFDDRNGDGLRDAGEKLLAGARIEVANVQRTPVASHVTDGSSEPYAFRGLAPGNYVVTEVDPPGYTSSSPNQWAVALLEGTEIDFWFADRFQPSPTPTLTAAAQRPTDTSLPPTGAPPTATLAPTPEPPREAGPFGEWLHSISGLLVATVALALPIAFRFLTSRS